MEAIVSIVSGIILCTGTDETDDSWTKVNAWLDERGFGAMSRLDDNFGGHERPRMLVGGIGVSMLPVNEFAAFVSSIRWERPDRVVLIIQLEEGRTRVWTNSARRSGRDPA